MYLVVHLVYYLRNRALIYVYASILVSEAPETLKCKKPSASLTGRRTDCPPRRFRTTSVQNTSVVNRDVCKEHVSIKTVGEIRGQIMSELITAAVFTCGWPPFRVRRTCKRKERFPGERRLPIFESSPTIHVNTSFSYPPSNSIHSVNSFPWANKGRMKKAGTFCLVIP